MTIRITSSHLVILLTVNTDMFLRLPEAGGGKWDINREGYGLERMKIILILKLYFQ